MGKNEGCSHCLDSGRVQEPCDACDGTGFSVEDGRIKRCQAFGCDQGLIWCDCAAEMHWQH
jgi:hypothetical protein